MKQVARQLCLNVTRGNPCNHPIEEHDSGGCCRAPFCECSRLVKTVECESGMSTVQIPAPEPSHDEYFVESKSPEVCRHAGVMSKEDCLHCNPRPKPRLMEGIELANFDIESASFADLAKWAYKAQKFIAGLRIDG